MTLKPVLLMTLAFVLADFTAAEDQAPVKTVEHFNVSTGGTGLYRPETWGVIRVSLQNSRDQDVRFLATTYAVDDPTLQYGRRLWLPPQSRMTSWHPIRIPAIKENNPFFDMRTQAVVTVDGKETMASNEFGSQQFDQSFLIAANETITAMIADPGNPDVHSPWCDPIDFALTARFDRGLRHNFTLLSESLAPPGEELLDAVDHLIIASDRIETDLAGIAAIRRWVTSGGRLWIMADKVSPETLAALLGDEAAITEVDRVGLTQVNMTPAPGETGTSPFERDLERPAEFVRLMARDVRIEFVVNDWPAALWKSYGNGMVLITTLESNGWLMNRTSKDPPPPGGTSHQTRFVAGGTLSQLALEFFTPRPSAPISREMAQEQVRELIGYSIPSRNVVLGILFGSTALLIVSGIGLAQLGRLEWMAALVPLFASAAALLLLSIGWSCRAAVPSSIAVTQLIQSVPGTDDIRSTGMAGIFSGDSGSAALKGKWGGWMAPEMTGMEGSTRRLVWSDIDEWNWESLPSHPGLKMIPFQTGGKADPALIATATLNSRGVSGFVSIPSHMHPRDAIIATPRGRLGVEIHPDGRFDAAASVLGANQYVDSPVLSDEQQRNSHLLAELLSSTTDDTSQLPTLYVWTNPWRSGLSVMERQRAAGAALVSMPLHWQRPTAASPQVTIPSLFLPLREIKGPDGLHPTGIYDIRHSRWVERSGSSSSWLAFQLPRDLLPMVVTSARITFKVLGPMERLEVSAMDDNRVHSIKVWDTPVGTLHLEITDTSLLRLDSLGRLLLRLDIGPKTNVVPEMTVPSLKSSPKPGFTKGQPTSYWQFEDVSLQLSAEILRDEMPSIHDSPSN